MLLLVPVGTQNSFAGVMSLEENSVHASWLTSLGNTRAPDSFETGPSQFDLFVETPFTSFPEGFGSCFPDKSGGVTCSFFIPNFVDPLKTKTINLDFSFTGGAAVGDVSVFCFDENEDEAGIPISSSSSTNQDVTSASFEFDCLPNPDWEVIVIRFSDPITLLQMDVWTVSFDDPPIVGGMGIPIDSSALLLASASSMTLWMVPVIAGIGIGVFVIRKRI